MCNDLLPHPEAKLAPLARALAERIEQLGRVLTSRALAHGLNSAQWQALRYLANAGDAGCRVGAFAACHPMSARSASQTMRALIRKGLVAGHGDTGTRRRILSLTEAGRQILAHDPHCELLHKLECLSQHQIDVVAWVIDSLTDVEPEPRRHMSYRVKKMHEPSATTRSP